MESELAYILKFLLSAGGWSGSQAVAVVQRRGSGDVKTECTGARLHGILNGLGVSAEGKMGRGSVRDLRAPCLVEWWPFMEGGKLDMDRKSVLERSRSSVLPTSVSVKWELRVRIQELCRAQAPDLGLWHQR